MVIDLLLGRPIVLVSRFLALVFLGSFLPWYKVIWNDLEFKDGGVHIPLAVRCLSYTMVVVATLAMLALLALFDEEALWAGYANKY